jgi:hypothetical protein
MSIVAGVYLGSAAADNAVVIDAPENVFNYTVFSLMSTAGAMDVYISQDGTNYTTDPIAMTDRCDTGAGSSDAVNETAAGRLYGFRGNFRKIKVLQKGATAVVGASLVYGNF